MQPRVGTLARIAGDVKDLGCPRSRVRSALRRFPSAKKLLDREKKCMNGLARQQ
jgi:hypothetical protein